MYFNGCISVLSYCDHFKDVTLYHTNTIRNKLLLYHLSFKCPFCYVWVANAIIKPAPITGVV